MFDRHGVAINRVFKAALTTVQTVHPNRGARTDVETGAGRPTQTNTRRSTVDDEGGSSALFMAQPGGAAALQDQRGALATHDRPVTARSPALKPPLQSISQFPIPKRFRPEISEHSIHVCF